MNHIRNTIVVVSINAGGTRTAHYLGCDLGKAQMEFDEQAKNESHAEVILAHVSPSRYATPAANAAAIKQAAEDAANQEEVQSDTRLAAMQKERDKLAAQLAAAEKRAKELEVANIQIKSKKNK